MTTQRNLAEQICQIGRRMYDAGFVAANDGNISVRLPVKSRRLAAQRFLCTPAGVSKGFLNPRQLTVVDSDGRHVAGPGRPTSEILMHLEIYRELPHVQAVCHAHPPHATAWAVAGEALPTGILPEVEVLLGPVPLARYETPGTKAFAKTLLPHLHHKANTILLASHGAVAFDRTLEQAYFHLETLEAYCRILLLVRQIGRPRRLPAAKLRELLEIKRRMGIDDPRL